MQLIRLLSRETLFIIARQALRNVLTNAILDYMLAGWFSMRLSRHRDLRVGYDGSIPCQIPRMILLYQA